MARKSQKEVVKERLVQFGFLTSMEAFERYGITRLSAIIFNLRREGLNVRSHTKQTKNRYGNNVNYAVYWLTPEDRESNGWQRMVK